jgi:hypothetical protein
VVEGIPVLRNTANTSKDARPQSNSTTISTNTSMAMLLKCPSQQVSELAKSGAIPASHLRLTSYKPMAKKGPTSKQPETRVSVYSGLCLNTKLRICAMNQKHTP